jgi:ElaB/YqjD/DUF883 family membrane-anchored ribosome-binding protein
MSHPPRDPRSSEDAREEAEHHRQEIVETLDALNDKLNQTVQKAEYQFNRPINWVRRHPLAALTLSVAAGFLLAGSPKLSRRRRAAHLTRELERAYQEGREDERGNYSPRQRPDWRESINRLNQEAGSRWNVQSVLFDLAQPVLKTISAGLAAAWGVKSAQSDNKDDYNKFKY